MHWHFAISIPRRRGFSHAAQLATTVADTSLAMVFVARCELQRSPHSEGIEVETLRR